MSIFNHGVAVITGKTRFARLFGTGGRSDGRRDLPAIHWENAKTTA